MVDAPVVDFISHVNDINSFDVVLPLKFFRSIPSSEIGPFRYSFDLYNDF